MLSVLLKFFSNAVPHIDLSEDSSVCKLEFLECDDFFYRYRGASQKDLLVWMYQLSRLDSGKEISTEDSENLYRRLWLEARNNNWIGDTELTYGVFQDFLYRYMITEKFNTPYYEGLVLDSNEINVRNFSDPDVISTYEGNLFEHILKLKSKKTRSKHETAVLNILTGYYQEFKNVKTEIVRMNHPANKFPKMPESIRQAILDNNLNEVLSSVTYDYSHDTSNRRFNVVTGASKLNGDVIQPGQVIDFMYELSDKKWYDYKWGWVILEGISQWQLGGGLCGSATLIYNPSWKAGLEIVTRYPHSLYYSSLYPENGVGLDATIYRNSHKNLRIKNNTNSPIIYYVEDDTENENVSVYLIGNSPYEKVEVEGPIQINRTTYKWVRKMYYSDGTVNAEELISKYGAIY